MERYDTYIGSNVSAWNVVFAIDDVDYAICTLKNNKAAGPDSLTIENLQHAGGRLPVFLTKLFDICLVHGFVPENIL